MRGVRRRRPETATNRFSGDFSRAGGEQKRAGGRGHRDSGLELEASEEQRRARRRGVLLEEAQGPGQETMRGSTEETLTYTTKGPGLEAGRPRVKPPVLEEGQAQARGQLGFLRQPQTQHRGARVHQERIYRIASAGDLVSVGRETRRTGERRSEGRLGSRQGGSQGDLVARSQETRRTGERRSEGRLGSSQGGSQGDLVAKSQETRKMAERRSEGRLGSQVDLRLTAR